MTKRKQQQLLCPKCHKVPVAHVNKYCDVCKAQSIEADKERQAKYQREYQKTHPKKKKPSAYSIPRKCKTESCESMVVGRRLYCDACVRRRDIDAKTAQFRNARPKQTKTYTGTKEWMNPINAHLAKNDGVYNHKPTDMPKQVYESKILRVRI